MPNLNDFLSAHHIGFKWKQKGKAMILSASKGSEWFFYQVNRDGLSAPAESQYEHSVYIGFCF
jgi:hypothetical protein